MTGQTPASIRPQIGGHVEETGCWVFSSSWFPVNYLENNSVTFSEWTSGIYKIFLKSIMTVPIAEILKCIKDVNIRALIRSVSRLRSSGRKHLHFLVKFHSFKTEILTVQFPNKTLYGICPVQRATEDALFTSNFLLLNRSSEVTQLNGEVTFNLLKF